MLTKNEYFVMDFIYSKCISGQCLITDQEILLGISHKVKMSQTKLKKILNDLSLDGYFDMLLSFKKGEPITLYSLSKKGYGYQRERMQSKRQIKYKIILAVVGGVLSFIVGRLLFLIFT